MRFGAATARIGDSRAPRWFRRVVGQIDKLNSRLGTDDVPTDIKRRIIEELADDIDLLAELTGFDLSEWKDVDA